MIPKEYNEILSMLKTNKDELYILIKSGKIGFNLCAYVVNNYNLYESFEATVLCHPNCTVELFKKTFRNISPVTNNHYMVLRESRLMSSWDIILNVLSYNNTMTMDKLVSTWFEYGPDHPSNLRLHEILINPYCNKELKNKMFDATQNIDFLPNEAKEIFIF